MRLLKLSGLAFLATFAAGVAVVSPASALSEIQREDLPAPETFKPDRPAVPDATVPPGANVPAEEPAVSPPSDEEAAPEEAEPDEKDVPSDPNRPEITEDGPLPEVSYDLAALPEPVRRMHDLIVEACKSADIEKLRVLIGSGDSATQLSLSPIEGDIIDFLKQSSGDGKGYEILAILEEVLSAGYVHLDVGKPEELFVWPYFFAIPLDRLTGRQQVELFKIVTAGDVEEMKTYGAYIFYRVGITPDGEWAFFLAGD